MSSIRSAIHRFATPFSICGLALLSACGSMNPTAAPTGNLPTGAIAGDKLLSPFYLWDAKLPEQPGTLLREETQPAQSEIDAAGQALRILYTSTDVRWNSGQIPVSGTLYFPVGSTPPGGWPVLAWAHGTLGIADPCAPSWAMHKPRDATYINSWLKAGFAVVATDYQGLGGPGPHPYKNWQAEGRSVLDAARAAVTSQRGRLANKVIVSGQSQGSGAALGAARLAGSYSSDLEVLGAVATGIISTFPESPYQPPATVSDTTFLSAVAGGLRNDAPSIDSLVSPTGKQLLDAARQGCSADVSALARKLKLSLSKAFVVPLEKLNIYLLPVSDMPMGKVNVPLLLGTGLADRTLTPQRQYSAVAALCASGTSVVWRKYPGLGHDGGLNGSFNDALAFARSRLAGQPAQSNCAEAKAPGPPEAPTSGIPFNDD